MGGLDRAESGGVRFIKFYRGCCRYIVHLPKKHGTILSCIKFAMWNLVDAFQMPQSSLKVIYGVRL